MNISTRKSKVLSLSIAQILVVISSFLSNIFFARELSVKDYGTYLQTFLVYDLSIPLLTLGLPTVLYYLLPRSNDRAKAIVLENYILLLLSGIFLSLLFLFIGTQKIPIHFNNTELNNTLKYIVLYPIYTFPILIASAVWVTYEKIKLNSIYNIVFGLILTISLIFSLYIENGINTPILVRVIIPLLFFPLTTYLIFKSTPGEWTRPNLKSMYSILKLSIPLGLASILGSITIQASNLIVSLLTSPGDYAIYSNGAREVPFIGIITGSISVIIMADMSKNIQLGKLDEALNLFHKAAELSASFLFPIMIFLLIFAENFIEILYSNKYNDSVLPFRVYLLIIPIRIAYYGSAFVAFGKTRLVLYRSILDLLFTSLFCYLFVLWFGNTGAALGLVLTLYIWSVPYNLYSLSKLFSTSIKNILPFKKIFSIILVSLISGVVASLIILFKLNVLYEIILSFSIYTAIYLTLSYYNNQEIRNILNNYINTNRIIFFLKK